MPPYILICPLLLAINTALAVVTIQSIQGTQTKMCGQAFANQPSEYINIADIFQICRNL